MNWVILVYFKIFMPWGMKKFENFEILISKTSKFSKFSYEKFEIMQNFQNFQNMLNVSEHTHAENFDFQFV